MGGDLERRQMQRHRETFRVTKLFYVFIVVVIIQLHKTTKTHQAARHLNEFYFMYNRYQ